MAQEQFTNNAETSLAAALDAVSTSVSVASATGFPTQPNFRIRIDAEIMLVTGVSGTTFTVQRGAEGTTAAIHQTGELVVHTLTAGAIAAVTAAYFGELSITNAAAPMTLATQNTFYPITQWDTVANANGTTPSIANHNIAIGLAGWWKLEVTLSGSGDAGSPTYEFSVFINGVEHVNAKVQQTMNAGTLQSWSISDLNNMNVGDVIDIRVRCTTAPNKAITLTLGNFLLFRVGS